MSNFEIVEKIYKKREEIIDNIDQESVDVYLWIKNEYEKNGDNIRGNKVFQFVFRSYYRLDNAGLSNEQKECFFKLLAQKESRLNIILEELHKLPTLRKKNGKPVHTVQFSFATKLLHTLDDTNPIFDSEIARVIRKSFHGKDKEERMESCEEIYSYLKELETQLISDSKIQQVIKEFRLKFESTLRENQMTNEKVLDFLLWSLGKLIKNEAKK